MSRAEEHGHWHGGKNHPKGAHHHHPHQHPHGPGNGHHHPIGPEKQQEKPGEQVPDEEPTEGTPDEELPEEETPAEEPEKEPIDTDVRDLLLNFLRENQLPESLMDFITKALAQRKSYAQILAELRETPEYKAAYPENATRLERGFDWMPEAEIRAYRAEARRLAQLYLGVANVTNEEIAELITTNKSLVEWERKLQRWKEFERWGPTVRAVLELELGYRIDDERLWAFFDETPTPELDRAYERALLRGQPAILGLGIRPEEEAEILRRYGISPDQAFRGYQGIVQELPRAQRLAMIEAEINRNVQRFPTGTELFADTPFATLFRAIQLGDPDAIRSLQDQLAREVARFQGQGGAVTDRSGAAVGLLTEDERNRFRV